MNEPVEELLYVACAHAGTGVDRPDFLAVVDAEGGRIVHETPMPNVGDELHHVGRSDSRLIVPGLRSSRIHVLDLSDPRRPRIAKVIEPDEVVRKTGYTRPNAVRCLPGGKVAISMLGDPAGRAAGGFALLDAKTLELEGRWEDGGASLLVCSEFGEPNAFEPGFDLADVAAHRYGSRLHFWDPAERRLEHTLELGENGLTPLGVRLCHEPGAEAGFVGAALPSTLWHWHRHDRAWAAEQVLAVAPVELAGWPFPVPGLIADLALSMDDRFLYFSNWLHGDLRRYDVSDPAHPKLTGRLWLGGVLGRPSDAGPTLNGGPQMLQLSLDGRRLYVTNSFYSTWDNQFYPGLRSWLLRVNCHPDGVMAVDPDFFVDLHDRPTGPARAHEVRLQGGDSSEMKGP